MTTTFKKIGLIGRQRSAGTVDTLLTLKKFLQKRQLHLVIEEETAQTLPPDTIPTIAREQLGKQSDLVIVVGGDGSMLSAALTVVNDNVPVLGINRGRLGFLTDIHPREVEQKIAEVLDGKYREEKRFLLTSEIHFQGNVLNREDALNDVVLQQGDVAHMIEFEIHINDEFVCTQRADGLIVATPTGSTAYALSGGGPIIHPTMNAIVLVPMFPHTLSSRPIVTEGNTPIKIHITKNNETSPHISCDGHQRIPVAPGSFIQIKKKAEQLRLIHPLDYNYFQTLRTKLHWAPTY